MFICDEVYILTISLSAKTEPIYSSSLLLYLL